MVVNCVQLNWKVLSGFFYKKRKKELSTIGTWVPDSFERMTRKAMLNIDFSTQTEYRIAKEHSPLSYHLASLLELKAGWICLIQEGPKAMSS